MSDGIVTVKGITGNVKYLRSGKQEWKPVRLNMTLRKNDKIATAAESQVRIETSSGKLVMINGNTQITVGMLLASTLSDTTNWRCSKCSMLNPINEKPFSKALRNASTNISTAGRTIAAIMKNSQDIMNNAGKVAGWEMREHCKACGHPRHDLFETPTAVIGIRG